jgi:hypothetical protein
VAALGHAGLQADRRDPRLRTTAKSAKLKKIARIAAGYKRFIPEILITNN